MGHVRVELSLGLPTLPFSVIYIKLRGGSASNAFDSGGDAIIASLPFGAFAENLFPGDRFEADSSYKQFVQSAFFCSRTCQNFSVPGSEFGLYRYIFMSSGISAFSSAASTRRPFSRSSATIDLGIQATP